MTESAGNQVPENEPPCTDDVSTAHDSKMMYQASQHDTMIGVSVGQYTIKRIIGMGGMGTVFEAMQQSPRRTVAIKMMKQGIASRGAMRRFEYEAQTLGRLRHENIAQIYEAGTFDDGNGPRPFFAMEYLAGAKTLTDYAREKNLGIRERLRIFSRICDAAHHGHQKGIIHRDLKPGNILITSSGEPKIIDFGVARSTDSDLAITTLQTDVGALIGTMQYMSPEQCDADPNDIDTRSDVYALGVVLYELMTDQLPYDVTNRAVHEAARIVREEAPTRPSTVSRLLRGDIETISLKALEKERDRRYQSAVEIRQDIDRYLSGDAITARRPSLGYQLKLIYNKHRAVVVLSLLVILLTVGAGITFSWLAGAQSGALREATRQADRSQTVIDGVMRMLSPSGSTDGTWPRDIPLEEVLDQSAVELAEGMAVITDETDVQNAAYLSLTIAFSYRSLGAIAKARKQVDAALLLLRKWYPEDHPYLFDAQVMSMMINFEEGREAVGMEAGRAILARKSVELGRYSPDTLATVWQVANNIGTAGYMDAASQLIDGHLNGITYEEATSTQAAYDAIEMLATIPATNPPPGLVTMLKGVVPPDTATLDTDRMEFVQEITWYLGRNCGHPAVALEILEQLEPALSTVSPNQKQRRLNRVYRGLMLFEMEHYGAAEVIFQEQVALDHNDPTVSDSNRDDLVNNLNKTRVLLQESSENNPPAVP
ncbi:MAG: serine/threonine-protein kinase [Phycisphaerales bacterium]|nr:serine/threonine-protein kinase [Phycisphaerales bacterium]